MFDWIGKVASIAVDTVTLPVSAAVDGVTLGGALVDRDEPYTVTKAKRIVEAASEAIEDLAE